MYNIEEIKNRIICGDCLKELKKFPNECIDLIITSPPYFGLRDYQVKGQIGLEKSPEEWLEKILKVTKELKRVLKKTGQFWLNIGDSYAGSMRGYGAKESSKTGFQKPQGIDPRYSKEKPPKINYQAKCLLLLPERLAIRMIDEQDWILRNKVKWAKQVLIKKENKTIGSVMPTSVKDRFNESGEEFYFFVKSKKYWSNLDRVRIPNQVIGVTDFRDAGILRQRMYEGSKYNQFEFKPINFVDVRMYENSKRNKFNYRVRGSEKKGMQCPEYKLSETDKICLRYSYDPDGICPICGRTWRRHASPNSKDRKIGLKREFIPCISYQGKFSGLGEKAEVFGSPRARVERYKYLDNPDPRGDNQGGPGRWRIVLDEPKRRKIDQTAEFFRKKGQGGNTNLPYHPNIKGLRQAPEPGEPNAFHPLGKNIPTIWQINPEPHNFRKELGIDIEHFAIFPQALIEIPIEFGCPKDGIVLDPFMGSGTVAIVAKKLSRNFIGIEISPQYCEMARKRLDSIPEPLF